MAAVGGWFGVLVGCLAGLAAMAQALAGDAAVEVDVVPVSLAIDGTRAAGQVSGELRLPRAAARPMPAVLILHSSPGFDGRGASYAEALHRAGVATLEIDYLRGQGIPATPRDNLPHVFQTLRHLAGQPGVDARRIGVLGFSWGGILAVLANSSALSQRYGGGLEFAAHAGLYPICWRHHAIATGQSGWFGREVYARLTGRPLLILAAGRDAFDDADSCERFVAALPRADRPRVTLTTYPQATFGWDSRFGSATYDPGVDKGRGGINTIVADPDIARQSRAAVVDFFVAALAPTPR